MRSPSPPSMRRMRLFHGALLTMSQGTAVIGEVLHVQASSNPSFSRPPFPPTCVQLTVRIAPTRSFFNLNYPLEPRFSASGTPFASEKRGLGTNWLFKASLQGPL